MYVYIYIDMTELYLFLGLILDRALPKAMYVSIIARGGAASIPFKVLEFLGENIIELRGCKKKCEKLSSWGCIYVLYIYTFDSASSKLELSIFEKLEPLSEWIEYVCMIRFSEYNKTPNFYGFYRAAGASFSSRINIVFAE